MSELRISKSQLQEIVTRSSYEDSATRSATSEPRILKSEPQELALKRTEDPFNNQFGPAGAARAARLIGLICPNAKKIDKKCKN